ncbi:GNAT family N-acetyltransferase [Flavisolibacter ginsenosidimutans]|uniref:GNAT family N-acetyltransferase n=1 Tax=Flavisolibacter ginsenosidimutans TaxID=661481 RepID=A0A5B8UJJ1_9BACT|nr:GNAT family protein [Flavisolibacter ginsenosidimutans]QEC56738.1 GNAT family N-acetyltransferase [Flavisolibacter ginsenosidimutans]
MNQLPQLSTNRLLLRSLQVTDIASLVKYANNKAIADNVLNIPHPYTEKDAVFWLNFVLQGFQHKERFVFAIVQKEGSEFIGAIGLHPAGKHDNAEMGYWLGEPFWGGGLMTEAAGVVLKFGFEELNLHKIYATHFTDNIASGKVMVNNGMIKEGELKDQYKVGDVYKSVIQYRLLKNEWAEMANASHA